MRAYPTPNPSTILVTLSATVIAVNLILYSLVLQQSEDLRFRLQLFEDRVEVVRARKHADPVAYRVESGGTKAAPRSQSTTSETQTEAAEDLQPNWRSQRARQRLQNLKPIDWQLARITRFERTLLQTRRELYDAAKPLGVQSAQAYLKQFSSQFGFDLEIALRETKRNHPWAMPIGARPAIHMRPVDRQPYLLAHEFAHVFTRTTNHDARFVRAYLDALVLLGIERTALEHELQRQGVEF